MAESRDVPMWLKKVRVSIKNGNVVLLKFNNPGLMGLVVREIGYELLYITEDDLVNEERMGSLRNGATPSLFGATVVPTLFLVDGFAEKFTTHLKKARRGVLIVCDDFQPWKKRLPRTVQVVPELSEEEMTWTAISLMKSMKIRLSSRELNDIISNSSSLTDLKLRIIGKDTGTGGFDDTPKSQMEKAIRKLKGEYEGRDVSTWSMMNLMAFYSENLGKVLLLGRVERIRRNVRGAGDFYDIVVNSVRAEKLRRPYFPRKPKKRRR